MAHITADRVRDTTTSTTSPFTVSGTAPAKYRTFSAVCAASDTTTVFFRHQAANEWQVASVTYSGTNQLTVNTVHSSSNGGLAVTFTAGTIDVVLDVPAIKRITKDNNNYVNIGDAGPFNTVFNYIAGVNITSSFANLDLQTYASAGGGAVINFDASRNATLGAHTIVQNNDVVGAMWFSGSDGVDFIWLATIEAIVDGTPGVNDMPGRLVFSTLPDGGGLGSMTEGMRITNDGRVVLYGGWPNLAQGRLDVAEIGNLYGLFLNGYGNNSTGGGIGLFKTRNASPGGHTIVQNDDYLGYLEFKGSDGDEGLAGAIIQARVDGTPGNGDMPGRIEFLTTPDGSAAPLERMRISNDGAVGVGPSGSKPSLYGLPVGFSVETGVAGISYYAPDAYPAGLWFGKSRHATIGSHTIVQNNDQLAFFGFGGSNGTVFDEAAWISVDVDGTPGASNDMPGRIRFATTPNASSSAVERMRIDSAGTVNVGPSGAFPAIFGNVSDLAVNSLTTTFALQNYHTSGADAPFIAMAKSKSGTVGTQSIVASDDYLAYIAAAGSDGTNFEVAADLAVRVDGTPGNNDMPGRWEFGTTPDGSTAPVERLRITNQGYVNIGAGTPPDTLFGGLTNLNINATNSYISVNRYSSGNNPAGFIFAKSRSNTVGAHTVLQNGDDIGTILFGGSDGTDFAFAAEITAQVDGTPGNNDMPTMLYFATTPDGTEDAVRRLTITSAGHIIARSATTTPPTLTVNGEWVMTPTSNTQMRISYRGSDGLTKTANITLA